MLHDCAVLDSIDERFFSPDHWRAQGALLGQASGRGCTYTFQYGQEQFVLRHYRRGGRIASVSKDLYLWTGLRSTRAWREMHLLKIMAESGLPVPSPAAARILRFGPVYRADLVTRCIPNTETLAGKITRGELPKELCLSIGACIRRFHDWGLYHADLNVHNILIDDHNLVWLIDFDRGKRCKPNPRRNQANLKRLQRSLKKVWSGKDADKEVAWSLLLQGYARFG